MNKKKPTKKPEEEKEIGAIQKERDEYLAGWKRAKADLINFKREVAETMGKMNKTAKREMVQSIIPALEALDESAKSGVEGLLEIRTLLLRGLQEEGVEVIEPEKGEAFNPRFHEAVEGEGDVIEAVVRKGYRIDEVIIKPAIVRVSESNN